MPFGIRGLAQTAFQIPEKIFRVETRRPEICGNFADWISQLQLKYPGN